MAPNVGHIEVTVDANTGKLKAQIVKGSREAGAAGARVLSDELGDLDTTKLSTRLKLLRAKIEAQTEDIRIDAEITMEKVPGQLKELDGMLRAAQQEVKGDLTLPNAVRVAAKIKKLRKDIAAAGEVKVKGEIHYDEFKALEDLKRLNFEAQMVMKELEGKVEFNEAKELAKAEKLAKKMGTLFLLRPEVDTTRAEAGIEKMRLAQRDMVFDAGVDTTRAQADFAAFKSALRDIDIGLNLVDSDIAYEMAKLRALLADVKVGVELDEQSASQLMLAVSNLMEGLKAGIKPEFVANELRRLRHDAEFDIGKTKALIKLHADAKAFIAETKAATEAAEALEAEIRVGADFSKIQDDFRVQRSAFEHEMWDINTRLRTGTFEADVERIRREQLNKDIEWTLKVNTVFFDAQTKAVRADQELADIHWKFVADMAELRAELKAYREKQELDAINLRIEADFSTLGASINKFIRHQKFPSMSLDMKPKADDAILAPLRAQLAKRFESMGDDAGKSFGAGLSNRMKLIAGAIVLLIEPAFVALEGAISAVTAAASSAFSAIAGGAGAAAPMVAGLAGAFAAVIVGMQGMGDAFTAVNEGEGDIKALNEALKDLSPSAQRFVTAFGGMRDVFSDIRRDVQQKLFFGLTNTLEDLAEETIPDVGESLEVMAESANTFFQEMADAAGRVDFTGLAETLQGPLDTMGQALANVFQAMEPFLTAAAPAAQALADSIAEGTQHLYEMIVAGEQSGGLTEFLLAGVDSLRLWGDLLKTIGEALFTLFEAGKDTGDSFVESLTGIVSQFDLWMQTLAGEKALAEFFQSGIDVIGTMAPILTGLRDAFDALITPAAIARFDALMVSIGDVLPLLAEMFGTLGPVTLGLVQTLESVLKGMQPIVDLIDSLPDGVVKMVGAFIVMNKVLAIAKTAFLNLAKAAFTMTPMNALMLGIAAAATVLVVALGDMDEKQKKLTARGDELSDALQDEIDKMLELKPATVDATEAMELFGAAQLAAGEDGEKLQGAIGLLGIPFERLDELMVDLETHALSTLQNIASDAGYSTQSAWDLADAVAGTDNNFENVLKTGGKYGQMIEQIAEAEGKSVDQVHRDIMAMAQLRDEQENLTAVQDTAIRTTISQRAAQDENAAAMLALAEDIEQTDLSQDGLNDVWTTWNRLLAESHGIIPPTAAEVEGLGEAGRHAGEGVETMRGKVLPAAESIGTLASKSLRAVEELEDIPGPLQDAETALRNMTTEAEDNATASDKLRAAWDLLFGTGRNLQESVDAQREAMNELQLVQTGGTEAAELRVEAEEHMTEATRLRGEAEAEAADGHKKRAKELREEAKSEEEAAAESTRRADVLLWTAQAEIAAGTALSKTTEFGLANRDMMRENAEAILDRRDNMLADGKSVLNVIGVYDKMRESLIQEAMVLGKTREEAEKYVNQLGIVPRSKQTDIILAGGREAAVELRKIEDLKKGAAKALDIEVTIPKGKLTKKELGELKAARDRAAGLLEIEASIPGQQLTKTQMEELETRMARIDRKLEPEIVLKGGPIAKMDFTELRDAGDRIDRMLETGLTIKGKELSERQLTELREKQNNIKERMETMLNVDDKDARARVDRMVEDLGKISVGADGTVTIEGSKAFETLQKLDQDMDGIPDVVDSAITINVHGMDDLSASTQLLKDVDGQHYQSDYTIVTHGLRGEDVAVQHGTMPRPYSVLAGEAGPEFFRRGTLRGLVSGPTMMGPGTQVTSAALTAALLRSHSTAPTKVVNLNMNVHPNAADPEAVAVSVMNRAAVMI